MRVVVRSQAPRSLTCPCVILHDWEIQRDLLIDAAIREKWDEVKETIPTFVDFLKKVDRACGTNVARYEKTLNTVAKTRIGRVTYLLFVDVIAAIRDEICGLPPVFTAEEIEQKAAKYM